jgi:hypothetical protein
MVRDRKKQNHPPSSKAASHPGGFFVGLPGIEIKGVAL